MPKRKNPPVRAGGGAVPAEKDPRLWAVAAAGLAKAIGVEAFVGLASMQILAWAGAPHWLLAIYGFALFVTIIVWREGVSGEAKPRKKAKENFAETRALHLQSNSGRN